MSTRKRVGVAHFLSRTFEMLEVQPRNQSTSSNGPHVENTSIQRTHVNSLTKFFPNTLDIETFKAFLDNQICITSLRDALKMGGILSNTNTSNAMPNIYYPKSIEGTTVTIQILMKKILRTKLNSPNSKRNSCKVNNQLANCQCNNKQFVNNSCYLRQYNFITILETPILTGRGEEIRLVSRGHFNRILTINHRAGYINDCKPQAATYVSNNICTLSFIFLKLFFCQNTSLLYSEQQNFINQY
ncbi:hypothetical protein pb186bvf_019338 [Paramecium bursaria]